MNMFPSESIQQQYAGLYRTVVHRGCASPSERPMMGRTCLGPYEVSELKHTAGIGELDQHTLQ